MRQITGRINVSWSFERSLSLSQRRVALERGEPFNANVFEGYVACEKLERLRPQLSGFAAEVKAKREPITQEELALELELLVRAFPNGKAEPDFVVIMVCAIAAMRPSIGAVQLARRELINKCKLLPAISEVRAALEEMTKFLDLVARRIHEFPLCLSFMKECRQLGHHKGFNDRPHPTPKTRLPRSARPGRSDSVD